MSLGKRGHAETRMGDRDFQTAWLCMVTGVPSGAFASTARSRIHTHILSRTPRICVCLKNHYFFNVTVQRVSFSVVVFIDAVRHRYATRYRFLPRSSPSHRTASQRSAAQRTVSNSSRNLAASAEAVSPFSSDRNAARRGADNKSGVKAFGPSAIFSGSILRRRHLSVRNSIHQSGLDYAALVTEGKRERERVRRACVHRICVCTWEMERFEGAKEARIEVERNWPWSTLRLDAAAAAIEGTKWARTRPRNKEEEGAKERERGQDSEEPREEKCSWDSGVDDQTPRQREKQQRRRRQKQRAALAVAEGGMPFIFSSLSSTSEALSHIFPAEARPRGFLARWLDAHLTENPAAGALLAVSYTFLTCWLRQTVSLTGNRQTRRLRKPILSHRTTWWSLLSLWILTHPTIYMYNKTESFYLKRISCWPIKSIQPQNRHFSDLFV